MAKIISETKIDFQLNISLNESEARAIDALVGYGDDPFIEKFYTFFGKHYMQSHEQGLREFFKSIRSIVPTELAKVDKARKSFKE